MCVTQWQVSQWLFLHPGSHGQYSSQTKNSNSFQGPEEAHPQCRGPPDVLVWLIPFFCLAEGSTSGAMSHLAIQDKTWLSLGLVLLLDHHLTVHMNCGENVAYLSSVLRERCEAVSTLKGSYKGDAPKIHNLWYKSVSEQGTPASHSITAGEAGLSERGREKISQEILVHSPPQNLALFRKPRQQSKSSATLRFSLGFSDGFSVVLYSCLPPYVFCSPVSICHHSARSWDSQLALFVHWFCFSPFLLIEALPSFEPSRISDRCSMELGPPCLRFGDGST